MSRKSRKRFRFGYILAWLIVIFAVGLFAIERSGLLADALRERIAWRLGPLGQGLEIRDVRLSLLTPSLEVEGVKLTSPKTGKVLLELDEIEIRFNFPPTRIDPIELVRIDGGAIRVNDELLSELRRIFASVRPEDQSEFVPPPAVLRRVELVLELPKTDEGENDLAIGTLSLATRVQSERRLSLTGELKPFLNGATRRAEPIAFEGTQTADGFEIEARTRDLAVSSEHFDAPHVLGEIPWPTFDGKLDLDAKFALRLTDAGSDLNANLRARLRDARIEVADHSPLESTTIEVAGAMRVAPGGTLWARESWSAHSRISGLWLDSAIDCVGSFGRAAPPDSLMLLSVHAPDFPLSDPEIQRLTTFEGGFDLPAVLEPRGLVDLTIATTFPMPTRENPRLRAPAALLRFGFDGRSAITFHGFPIRDPETGELLKQADSDELVREGFPIPSTLTGGQVIVHFDPASQRKLRVALRGIKAESQDSSVAIEGVISAPEQRGQPFDLDLRCELLDLKVGEELRVGLAGLIATRKIWEDYSPSGGSLRGHVQVAGGTDLGGLLAQVDLDVDRIGATWSELAVPLTEVSGVIDVRFGERSAPRFRPVGAHVMLHTDPVESTGLKFDLRYRQDTPFRLKSSPRLGVALDVERLLLRGTRWEQLRAEFPEAGKIVSELNATGAIRLAYRGSQTYPGEPFAHITEITPGDPMRLQPTAFPRTTSGLRGRVLIRTDVRGPEDLATEAHWNLSGTWPGGVDLASQGFVPTSGPTRGTVVVAGVDPSNEAFRGALTEATSGPPGTASIDLTENAVEGRLDARIELTIAEDPEQDPTNEVSLWLRGNTFRNDSIELSGLSGSLVQSGDVFRAAELKAELGGHPIQLEQVALFPLGGCREIAEADLLLARKNYWHDPNGLCLQAKLSTTDLPLDETHLKELLSTEALEWIRQDPDWSGMIDLNRAQLVLTNEDDGSGKVAIYGDARVHDMTMRPGLALGIESLHANVRELVVEAGRIRMWCEVDNLDATIEGRPLEDATMIVSYLDGRLTVGNLDGSFCGGRLRSIGSDTGGASTAIAADLGEPYGFDLRLSLEDVEADSFLRGVFQSSVADQGQVDAALFLRGRPSDILGIRGNGWVNVREAQLYSIPVIRALFGALGFDEKAVFDRMRTRFQWRDGRIHMNDIVVKSSLLKLVGDGWMDLDGALSHDLELRYSLIDRLGPLSALLNWINKALVRVRIRGDMDRPKIQINTLISTLLGQRQPKGRDLPLPPFAELEERF